MDFSHIRRRTAVRIFSFALTALVVLAGYGIQKNNEAEAYRQQLSLGYRHAFAELAANLDGLNTDLQKGLYATSPSMLGALCTQIYGRSVAAQQALGELPYSNVELERTAALLAKVGDYAAYLSRSAAVNGGCSEEDRARLKSLSAGAGELAVKVAGLQADLLSGSADLEDVQAAEARLSASTEGGAVTAGSAYKTVESDFPELPSLIYDGPFSEHIAGRTPKVLEGLGQVSPDEARTMAAQFLNLKPGVFTLVSSGGGSLPVYGFSAWVDGGEVYIEVSRAGGRVVELMSARSVPQALLTREEALTAAADFLTAQGYPSMVQTYFTDTGNVLTINFAYAQDGVICYPDLIKVSIALDTGRVVGFESKGYLMNHSARSFTPPAVSEAAARRVVSPELAVLSHQLALIPTGGEYEVLTHEYKCETQDGRHVLVYVSAQTGQEERILLLLEDESGTLVI